MLSETAKNSTEKGFMTLRILWGAILASLFIYLVIAHLLGGEVRQRAGATVSVPLFRNVLIVIGIIEILIIRFLRKRMLSKDALLKLRERRGPSDQMPIVAQYTTVVVISAALAESIGIYGLLLYFLGADIQTFYVFLAVSAALLIFYRPKKEELATLVLQTEAREASSNYP
jgi:hypothetical protein